MRSEEALRGLRCLKTFPHRSAKGGIPPLAHFALIFAKIPRRGDPLEFLPPWFFRAGKGPGQKCLDHLSKTCEKMSKIFKHFLKKSQIFFSKGKNFKTWFSKMFRKKSKGSPIVGIFKNAHTLTLHLKILCFTTPLAGGW